MQDNWYENNSPAESGWYAPASDETQKMPPRRKRRWKRLLLVCILVAIAVTGSIFLLDKPPALPSEEADAPKPPESSEDIFKLPRDYRDYFSQLYGIVEEAEECSIPRVKNYENAFELSIQDKGTQALSYTEIYAKCAPTV